MSRKRCSIPDTRKALGCGSTILYRFLLRFLGSVEDSNRIVQLSETAITWTLTTHLISHIAHCQSVGISPTSSWLPQGHSRFAQRTVRHRQNFVFPAFSHMELLRRLSITAAPSKQFFCCSRRLPTRCGPCRDKKILSRPKMFHYPVSVCRQRSALRTDHMGMISPRPPVRTRIT